MVKDYIQDIVPPHEEPERRIPVNVKDDAHEEIVPEEPAFVPPTPARSIRNINVIRQRPQQDRREVPPVGGGLPIRRRGFGKSWLWAIVAILIIAIGVVAVFIFRPTTVTMTPRSQTIVFDASNTYTAYPAESAATGTLTYTVQSFDIEDSEVVAAGGTAHAEHKASGTVTVVNEFSTAPVHLVKTTRFQTPDGLVFRAPADITIPGMKGNTPGTIDVTLVADQSGSTYNVGPTAKFTLPGLKSGAMFTKVYARSTQAFSGGFSGDEPSVAADTLAAATTEIRARLQDKIASTIAALPDTSTTYASLASITYADAPNTQEDTTHVRINEKAHVDIPVFATRDLNRTIATAVSADAENADLTLIPKDGFAATDASTSTSLGNDPVSITFSGTAQIVWNVDTSALSAALAGKDQSAFQTIVNGFPGIQEARARIEPFWKSSFPADPKDIHVVVNPPAKP